MRVNSVAPALRERLGHDATMGLLDLVESEQSEWSSRMMSVAVERFERRLAEELAELRVTLVREIHDTRSETIKWAFIFWVSQVSAFLALLAFAYRAGVR